MPKLSIVVPTRERSDTLLHTIRTLVNQNYQSCEIIISDNASKDNTREVVESFSDSRIRYINTGKRVGMSENWEFALGHVRGDFVTYIGDDDGFIPGAITKAMSLIEKSQMNALVWDKVEYCWPDYVDENMRNWFSLRTGNNVLQVADGYKRLSEVIKFCGRYTRLPCLYNGIIRKCLLDKIRASSTNRVFFNSISPDIFSGIVLSMVVGKYFLTDYPFSVNGASRHSNGTSFMRARTDDVDSPFAKFISENLREYDSRVKMGPSVVISIMGEHLLARQFLPSLHFPEPPWNCYVHSLIRNARSSFFPEEVLQSAAHTAKLLGLRIKIPDGVMFSIKSATRLGMQRDSFSFKVPVDMVNNVYDACQLVAGMLPNTIGDDAGSPFNRFVKRMSDCFMSEAKTLYQSFF